MPRLIQEATPKKPAPNDVWSSGDSHNSIRGHISAVKGNTVVYTPAGRPNQSDSKLDVKHFHSPKKMNRTWGNNPGVYWDWTGPTDDDARKLGAR